jgi:DNA-binding CsgD family transcriptional regulator
MSPQQGPFLRGLLSEMCPLLIAGLSDSQISVELDVDEIAVSEYISWLIAMLGLANRRDLLLMLSGYFATPAA